MTEWWQDMMDFFCTTWSPCHNSIFCSAFTLCTMGPHCTRAQKHTHPRSLLSAVQNVLFLYDVAKSIWNDIHIAMATVGGSLKQVWFSSLSFKETFVLSARRSDPTDMHDITRSIWPVISEFVCSWYALQDSKERIFWPKNAHYILQCSSWPPSIEVPKPPNGPFIFPPLHMLTYDKKTPACCQTVSTLFPIPLSKTTWVTCQILRW